VEGAGRPGKAVGVGRCEMEEGVERAEKGVNVVSDESPESTGSAESRE